jgi:hypothetical protein
MEMLVWRPLGACVWGAVGTIFVGQVGAGVGGAVGAIFRRRVGASVGEEVGTVVGMRVWLEEESGHALKVALAS